MHQTEYDQITGLFNRKKLYEFGLREFQRYFRYKHNISMLIAAIDDYELILERYGTDFTNELVKSLSHELEIFFRPTDVISRYSEDQFAVMMPETSLEAAKIVAERLRNSILMMNFENIDGPVAITVSIGVADMNGINEFGEFDDLLQLAEKALENAKLNGMNQVSHYN
jgi:diguanylate cyclase (GGDEF)-like protein